MSRREFLMLTTAAAAMAVEGGAMGEGTNSGPERIVDAGPASNFTADGVYDAFRSQGFFLVRKGAKLVALSAFCTHRKFQLKARPDCSFYCNRHGSTFDPNGHVTMGPAKHDLPVFDTSVSETGHLLVKVSPT